MAVKVLIVDDSVFFATELARFCEPIRAYVYWDVQRMAWRLSH